MNGLDQTNGSKVRSRNSYLTKLFAPIGVVFSFLFFMSDIFACIKLRKLIKTASLTGLRMFVENHS